MSKTKPIKWPVRSVNTPISLDIHTAHSEDSDQTRRMPRLIWVLARLTGQCLVLSCYSYMDRVKRIWYLSPMRAAKVQASLRIRAVSSESSLLAHTSSESSGTFRQKARSLAPLNGWACAVKICHDGMLEDTNSLDAAHMFSSMVSNHPEKNLTRTSQSACLHRFKLVFQCGLSN